MVLYEDFKLKFEEIFLNPLPDVKIKQTNLAEDLQEIHRILDKYVTEGFASWI